MQETFRKTNVFQQKSANSSLPSFTTIDALHAIGYLQISCACARYDVSDRCKPNYGACVGGKRSVPIELLDVAGLVPGAHEGKGLGNKFLDDLRHADALVHVVDVSGTTDAEGRVGSVSRFDKGSRRADAPDYQGKRPEATIRHRILCGSDRKL